jgi:hypothetical protein
MLLSIVAPEKSGCLPALSQSVPDFGVKALSDAELFVQRQIDIEKAWPREKRLGHSSCLPNSFTGACRSLSEIHRPSGALPDVAALIVSSFLAPD